MARAHRRFRAEEILLWVWVGVVFVFFSIARFKVDRYVYPAAPACCLLAARAWMSVSVIRPDLAAARDNVFARWSVVMLGGILVVAAAVSGFSLFDLGLDLPRAALLIPLSLAVGGGVVLEATILRRKAVSPVVFGAVLVMLLVIYGCVVAIGLPVLERARPTEVVADSLRPNLSADDQVALYRLEKWRFSLRYYLERPLGRLEEPGGCQEISHRQGELHSDARRGFRPAAQGRHQPAGRQRAARRHWHDWERAAPAEVGLAGRGDL